MMLPFMANAHVAPSQFGLHDCDPGNDPTGYTKNIETILTKARAAAGPCTFGSFGERNIAVFCPTGSFMAWMTQSKGSFMAAR